MLLNGKIALITGAANGNGAAIARGLSREGAIVIIADIDLGAATILQDELRDGGAEAHAFLLDVSVAEQCKNLEKTVLEKIGCVDVLVNNAGIRPRHKFDSSDRDASWVKAMDVNVGGIRNMPLAFMTSLKESKGCVINITSIAATNASPMSIAYSTSKAAAQMLSKVLALELAQFGIRVNAIAPGIFETDMTKSSRQDPVRSNRLMTRIPMSRYGNPDELVGPVVFLATNMSSYMTGATITVDGGYLAV